MGEGWNEVDRISRQGPGISTRGSPDGSSRSQELWECQHTGFLTGEFEWRGGAKVGIGWGPGNLADILVT